MRKHKYIDINELADLVICYLNNSEIDVTPLKLQKILYYIQAWHLVFFDKNPLFSETPEAWVNGPVYRAVYSRFKDSWVWGETLSICESEELENKLQEKLQQLQLNEEQEKYLFAVLQRYEGFSAGELVCLTHAEPPWNEAREGYGPLALCDKNITHEAMYKYFNSVRNKNA